MPQAAKSLLALVVAVGLVVGAVFVRSALDNKKVSDAVRVRLTCDPAVIEACRKAAAADERIELKEEEPAKTRARLRDLEPGEEPGLDAWVTVGPWMAMTEGARAGQPALARSVAAVATTPVNLVVRPGNEACASKPVACDKVRNIGILPPPVDGVGLAASASIVATAAGIPVADLDRDALISGAGADPLRMLNKLAKSTGLDAVNASFGPAQAIVTTAAAARAIAPGRVATVHLNVRAVMEVALLSDGAAGVMAEGSPAGQALRRFMVDAGWEGSPQPSGLPDAGVLAALQEAWTTT